MTPQQGGVAPPTAGVPVAAASEPGAGPRPRWWARSTFWALLGALAVGALYGRVALLNLTTAVVGGDIDGYENLWNHYWVQTALLDLHQSPFYTNYLYYPTGISLRFHALSPITGLLSIPLNLTIGYVPATNLIFVSALVLTVFCAFLLIRDLVGNPWAAFAGAVLFTFANQHVLAFYFAGQDNLISGEWLPLYFFFLFRALYGRPMRGPDARFLRRDGCRWPLDAALAVGTLIVMSLTDWEYVMWAVFTTLLYFAFVLVTRRSRAEKGRLFGKLAAIGGVYAVLVFPPLVLPMIQEALANPWLAVSDQSGIHSADLLDLLGPGAGNPGYLAVALAVLGLVVAWRGRGRAAAAFWALAAVVFYAISLGPYLIVGGRQTSIPLLYGLIQNLPVFSVGRDPGRFEVIGRLGIAILAALGLRALFAWLPAGARRAPRLAGLLARRRLVAAGVVGLFLLLSSGSFVVAAGAVKADPPDWPPFFRQIAADPASYAILELPLFTEKGRGEDHYQAYQALSHKPRFGGRWSRDHKLTNPNNFVKTASLFRHLWLLDAAPAQRDFYYPDRDFLQGTEYRTQGLAILNYYHVRYIVVYQDALTASWSESTFQAILGQVLGPGTQPYYQDRLMRVYRVPDGPPAANPVTLDVGNGWFAREIGPDGTRYRWADSADGQPSELYAMNLTAAPRVVTLHYTAYAFQHPRTLRVALNGTPIMAGLLDDPATGPIGSISLQLTLRPGNNLITFSTPDPPLPTGAPQDARRLSFALSAVSLR